MTALRIAAVEALEFGRHQQFALGDLDHDFVVVFGPNESGKSTLAEFLTWAIGGPWRAFKDGSTRYRPRPGVDVVGGRLLGRLGDERFDLAAGFKLLAKGQPTDNRLLEIGGISYGGGDIGNLLGGLTADDYELVYRLYGVELGQHKSGEKFSDLFTRFALDSTQATLNPRQRLVELTRRRDALVAERRRRARDLKEIDERISRAASNPERIRAIDVRLDHIARRTAELDLELAERRDESTDLDIARAARGARDTHRGIAEELEAIGRLPGDWVPVVAVADQIGDLRHRLVMLGDEMTTARRVVDLALDRAGVTEDDCRRHGWTPADRLGLQVAHRAVLDAVAAQLAADDRLEDVVSRSREVSSDVVAATRALALPTTASETFVGRADTVRILRNSLPSWVAAHGDLLVKGADLAAAETARDTVEAEPDPEPATPERPPAWPFLIAAVAAAALAFVHPAAGVAGVVAVAAVWAIVDHRSSSRRTEGSARDSRAERLRDRHQEVERAARELARATKTVDDQAAALRAEIGEFGLELPSPHAANEWLDQIDRLVGAADAARRLETDHAAARSDQAVATTALADSRRALADRLTSWGLTTTPADDAFIEWLEDFGAAHQHVADLDHLVAEHQRLTAELDTLLAPVAGFVATRPAALVDQEIDRYRKQAARIAELEADLATAEAAVRAARADQPEIAELLDRHRSDDALVGAKLDLATSIEALEAERMTLVEERIDLRRERDDLEAVEILPGLHLERGDVLADLDELDAEHDATDLAARILADVIDHHERTNQNPLIQRAQGLIEQVVDGWGTLMYSRDPGGKVVIERDGDGGRLDDSRLSDGGRALLYLGVRIACAERDLSRRGIALPLLCDDPLIHFDDARTIAGLRLLKDVAGRHQVIVFTCEESTRDLAGELGAHLIDL